MGAVLVPDGSGMGGVAATLFALVGMHNAAPGIPPAGSLFDYASFFWAELLIAAGLCAVVVQGLILEVRERRAEHPDTDPAPGPDSRPTQPPAGT
ncbi:DUF4436 family protein [Streptomyces sp. NPDC052000]|uniref:DUF4436 family protein n=1 Tax=Streptomyces sp. NPDC052000 TaxID=3155676 RepID=UPI00344DD79F